MTEQPHAVVVNHKPAAIHLKIRVIRLYAPIEYAEGQLPSRQIASDNTRSERHIRRRIGEPAMYCDSDHTVCVVHSIAGQKFEDVFPRDEQYVHGDKRCVVGERLLRLCVYELNAVNEEHGVHVVKIHVVHEGFNLLLGNRNGTA